LTLADKNWLMLVFLALALNILLISARLKLVFSIQGFHLNLANALYLTLIGFFFNSFLPTAVGGDIVKAYYASEMFSHKKIESYAAVFADRIVGLVSIATIAFASVLITSEEILSFKVKSSFFIVSGLILLLVIFALNKKLAARFKFLLSFLKKIKLENISRRVYAVFNNFKNYKKLSCIIYIISIVAQLVFILIYFILSRSLGLRLPFSVFLLFIPLVMVASLIPSIGGIGPREGALVMLFGALISQTEAAALAILWLVFFLGLSAAGGIIYLLSGKKRLPIKKIKKEADYDQQRIA
jgi:glycosyltransferase 2 family protein